MSEATGACPLCGGGRGGTHYRVRKAEFRDVDGDLPADCYEACPNAGKPPWWEPGYDDAADDAPQEPEPGP